MPEVKNNQAGVGGKEKQGQVNGPRVSLDTKGNSVETKADKWKRLANLRLPKAMKAINILGNLGSKTQYEYTPEQVGRMLELLRKEVDNVAKRYTTTEKTAVPTSIF